jgi:hypothetical protein
VLSTSLNSAVSGLKAKVRDCSTTRLFRAALLRRLRLRKPAQRPVRARSARLTLGESARASVPPAVLLLPRQRTSGRCRNPRTSSTLHRRLTGRRPHHTLLSRDRTDLPEEVSRMPRRPRRILREGADNLRRVGPKEGRRASALSAPEAIGRMSVGPHCPRLRNIVAAASSESASALISARIPCSFNAARICVSP